MLAICQQAMNIYVCVVQSVGSCHGNSKADASCLLVVYGGSSVLTAKMDI